MKRLILKKLTEIIKRYNPDIVVEAVDREEVKQLIFETSLLHNKVVITANGLGGFGDCENIRIIRKKRYTIIGDLLKSIKDFKPLAPKVTAVASMQADEVLRRVIRGEV